MIGRQRGSSGYDRVYASTPSYDNSATGLFTMRVYSSSLETRTLVQEVFKS